MTLTRLPRWARHLTTRLAARLGPSERGSVSLLVVATTLGLLLLTALIVDGGRKAQNLATTTSIAEEAARAAGQAIDPLALAQGRPITLDPTRAAAEARAYLAAAQATGTVTVTGTTLTVTVTRTRPTVFLGALGITQLTVTRTAKAELVTGAGP